MRVGDNPEKNNGTALRHGRHRVIIPVYIPDEDGYHANAFEVFRLCIESLARTIGEDTRISVVNNASIGKVDAYCRILLEEGIVDRYIVNFENRGKPEAVLAAARGSWEDFITISDADILFLPGWEERVAGAFRNLPKAGVIGLLTSPVAVYRSTSSVLIDSLLGLRLRMGRPVADELIREFSYSIGLDGTDAEKRMLETPQYYIDRKGERYLLGANHAAATYRREIFFDNVGERVSHAFNRKAKLDYRHFDMPSDRLGFWRLSFTRPVAYHMGNHVDDYARARVPTAGAARPRAGFPDRPARRSWSRLIPFNVRVRAAHAGLRMAFRLFRRGSN